MPMRMSTTTSKTRYRRNESNFCQRQRVQIDFSFVDFFGRDLNIFPQALINYIILNGGGFHWGESLTKSYSMDELVEAVCI